MFSTLPNTKILILPVLNLSSANSFNLVQSRKLSFGKELRTLKENPFGNSGGQENAGDQHLILNPQYFPPYFY